MGKVRFFTGGRRLAALAAVGAAVAAIGGAASSAPASAAAATPHVAAIDLDSNIVNVTSSTGRHLELEVHAYVEPNAPSNDEADVTLTQENNNGEEDHSWMFPIHHTTDLDVDTRGQGTLRLTSKEISPFGSLSLTMTPAGKTSTQKCNGVAAGTVTPVKLTGSFFFNSHSTGAKKWGSVGTKSPKAALKFPGKAALTQIYSGGQSCLEGDGGDDVALPCTSALIWDSSSSTADINGFEFLGINLVNGSRIVSLHGNVPGGSLRADDVTTTAAAPTWLTAPNATVATLLDGLLATVGKSATLTGTSTVYGVGGESKQNEPCGSAGNTETATYWPSATYTNGANPLTLNTSTFGGVHVPNNTDATLLAFAPASTSTPIPTPTPTPTTTSSSSASVAHLAVAGTISKHAALTFVEHYEHARRWHHAG
jgi:hypothetical protein